MVRHDSDGCVYFDRGSLWKYLDPIEVKHLPIADCHDGFGERLAPIAESNPVMVYVISRRRGGP